MLQYWVRFTLQEAYLHQKQLVNTNYSNLPMTVKLSSPILKLNPNLLGIRKKRE